MKPKYLPHIDLNVSEIFGSVCKRTINATHTIFNTEHALGQLHITYNFRDNTGIFTKVRVWTDRRTVVIHTFQPC